MYSSLSQNNYSDGHGLKDHNQFKTSETKTVDSPRPIFRVTTICYEIIDQNAFYDFRITAAIDNICFEIKDRYSSIRHYFMSVIKEHQANALVKSLPSFPPKTFVPNLSEKFMTARL